MLESTYWQMSTRMTCRIWGFRSGALTTYFHCFLSFNWLEDGAQTHTKLRSNERTDEMSCVVNKRMLVSSRSNRKPISSLGGGDGDAG